MQLYFKTSATILSFLLTCLFTLASSGAETQTGMNTWPSNGMNHRVAIQVDENLLASGGLFELPVDLKKLTQAQSMSGKKPGALLENNLALGVWVNGKLEMLPFRYRTPNDATGESILHFILPPEASTLKLYFDSNAVNAKAKPMDGSDNIANHILNAESCKKWLGVSAQTCRITREDNGLLFDVSYAPRDRRFVIYTEVELPTDCAGRDAFLEADLVNLSKMGWGFGLTLRQFDASGKELPSSVTDPRWSQLALPHQKEINFRIPGRFDPRAKKVQIRLAFHAIKQEFDLYGRPLKDLSAPMPKLLIKRLVLRGGNRLRLQPVNDQLFGVGASGKDDSAFRLNGRNGFLFNVNGQAVWGEHRKVFEQSDYFWPFDDGTIEFRIKPEQWPADSYYTLCAGRSTVKRDLFAIQYSPKAKKLGFTLLEPNNKSANIWKFAQMREVTKPGRRFTEFFPAELKEGNWYHIAVCWKWNDQIAVFVNGQCIGSTSLKGTTAPDFSKIEYPDQIVPNNVFLGFTGRPSVLSAPVDPTETPFFKALIDDFRISKTVRYQAAFKPTATHADADTLALFRFNKTYNGISSVGESFIEGSLKTEEPPRASCITVETRNSKSEQFQWVTKELPKTYDPGVLLDCRNYVDIPEGADFLASHIVHEEVFTLSPTLQKQSTIDATNAHDTQDNASVTSRSLSNSCKAMTFTQTPHMDYIEIRNVSPDQTLKAPIVLNEGDIDPRSYGDMADTMRLDLLPDDRARVLKMFNLLLHSEDYFMSHQAEVARNQRSASGVEYHAMSMFSGYCAFECGPLNNLAVNLFVNIAKCPATQTSGYWHSFQQVFYNNKMNLYDLSAQTFFPSRDQISPAGLDEIERDLLILGRVRYPSSPEYFFRQDRRPHGVHQPLFMKRRSYDLRPGESFKICWANNGVYNDLQKGMYAESTPLFIDKTKEAGIIPETKVGAIEKPFPHYASCFLTFNGRPAKTNPAFFNVTPSSFCYRVDLPYPIVEGRYRAEVNGKTATIEVSDDGKFWNAGVEQKDGSYYFDYPVRARLSFIVRVNADITKTNNFTASTTVMANPRRLTGALKQGVNRLTLKADEGPAAEVRLRYRMNSDPIVFKGGAYSGAIKGLERQVFVMSPDAKLEIETTGATANATVTASDGLQAVFTDGKIIVSAKLKNNQPAVAKNQTDLLGEIVLTSGTKTKRATILCADGIKLLRAEQAQLAGGSYLAQANDRTVMPVVRFRDVNSSCTFKLQEQLQGPYAVFSLIRPPQRHYKTKPSSLLKLKNVNGNTETVGSLINSATEFFKAGYGKDLSRFKWDYPIKGSYPYQILKTMELPTSGVLTLTPDDPSVEFAALLIVPAKDEMFIRTLVKALNGLNYDPFTAKSDVF